MAGLASDETKPKVISETCGQTMIDRAGASEGLNQCERNTTGGDRPTAYEYHQCAHTENLLNDEITLHQPKQEDGDPNRYNPPFQTGSSVEEEDYDHITSGDTLDHSRSRGNSWSSSVSSSLSNYTLCDICSAVNKALLCSESKLFWEGIESKECCRKAWGHFKERLNQTFPEERALQQGRVIHLLKALLGVNDAVDFVEISKYLNLIKFFGPFRSEGNRCIVLQQLQEIVASFKDTTSKRKVKCWFAGPMTGDEANTRLEGKAPETFLIRMSHTEMEEGNFILSLVMKDRTVEHFRLKGNHEEAVRSDPFSLCLEFRGRKFSSLPTLVNDYLRVEFEAEEDATECKTVCPDLPFNRIINSYR